MLLAWYRRATWLRGVGSCGRSVWWGRKVPPSRTQHTALRESRDETRVPIFVWTPLGHRVLCHKSVTQYVLPIQAKTSDAQWANHM